MNSIYGIIGHPLSHSFSPAYFNEKFTREHINAQYKAFELPYIHDLPEILKNHPTLRGLNVTIPHKQAIIDQLDALSSEAAEVGAVNCIDIRDGILKGYNTDVIGFERSLAPVLQPHHRHALIFGTGGAALAVKFVLRKLGIPFKEVSRKRTTATLSYSDIDEAILKEHTLLINTTPLGMYPHTDEAPDIPYSAISEKHLLYDLIYNPPETRFLLKGKEQGAAIKNGLDMLKLQADASWEIWSS